MGEGRENLRFQIGDLRFWRARNLATDEGRYQRIEEREET
jgi:hypothetical protein